MILVERLQRGVVGSRPIREQFGVIVVGTGSTSLPVGKTSREYVNEVVGHFSFRAQSEVDDSLGGGVDGLILADDHIVPRLPLEPPLPGDDVVGHHLFSSELFESKWLNANPSLRPAESLVFWVEEACILEAWKTMRWVRARRQFPPTLPAMGCIIIIDNSYVITTKRGGHLGR